MVVGAESAAKLDWNPGRFDDLADNAGVHRLSGFRAVEIDDVKAIGAEFDPSPRDR